MLIVSNVLEMLFWKVICALIFVIVDLSSLSAINLGQNAFLGDETNKVDAKNQLSYSNQLCLKSLQCILL